jgi:glycosyltransferase involved in cell wall biosynthesis
MTIVEGLGVGVPLIVSNIGAMSTDLQDDENCLKVGAADSAGWHKAIRRVSQEPMIRQRLSIGARRLFERRHTGNGLIADRLSAYSTAMAGT